MIFYFFHSKKFSINMASSTNLCIHMKPLKTSQNDVVLMSGLYDRALKNGEEYVELAHCWLNMRMWVKYASSMWTNHGNGHTLFLINRTQHNISLVQLWADMSFSHLFQGFGMKCESICSNDDHNLDGFFCCGPRQPHGWSISIWMLMLTTMPPQLITQCVEY